MNDLIKAIEAAYQSPEDETLISKAHRVFLSHIFILPIRKDTKKGDEPEALYYNEDNKQFLPLFSSDDLFRQWAGDSVNDMGWLTILGKDVILGTSDGAYLCLDIGQTHYKELAPSEVQRLRQVILKLERIVKAAAV